MEHHHMMQESRAILQKIGLPTGDYYELFDSHKRFVDGGQYRYEVYGVQSPEAFKALMMEVNKEEKVVHRVTQTNGIMNLTDAELNEMIQLAQKEEVQLLLAVGPRATTDISPSIHTPKGVTMGLGLRGQEQIVRAMEDVLRGVRCGGRGFLVYDEGCLWVLNKMRVMGELPKDCHFKFSASAGYGNPCSIKVIEELGADSVNPVWDLEAPKLSAIRAAVDIPIDVHMVVPKQAGGFIRYYDAPVMIKVASPIYLKVGAMEHSWNASPEQQAHEKVKQMQLVAEMITAYYPEAVMSPKGSVM